MKYLFCLMMFFSGISDFTELYNIDSTATDFEIDALDQVYLIENNSISKYSSTGELMSEFRISDYGDIQSLDVSNIMKPFVFFRNTDRIFMLDSELSQSMDAIDLSQKYPGSIIAACQSNNNHLWLYNQSSQKLIRTDYRLNIINESSSLGNWIDGTLTIHQMIEKNDILYVYDKDKGIFKFDVFGTYLNKISLSGFERFTIHGSDIWYVKNGCISKYNTKNHRSEFRSSDSLKVGNSKVFNERIYHLSDNIMKVYNLN